MAKIRARIISASVWVIRAGSRRSGKQRANRSATPRRRSAIDSNMAPPSEVRRPPSKSAVTFLRATDGNENGGRLSSVMAGAAGELCAKGWFRHPNPTPPQSLRLCLPAFNAQSVNKSGFRNGPLVVKSLVSTSPIYGAPRERAVDCAVASAAPASQFRRLRRRSLASVRGRRDGRHMMPSEETASLSNHAWSVS